jgi:hypothetical protein
MSLSSDSGVLARLRGPVKVEVYYSDFGHYAPWQTSTQDVERVVEKAGLFRHSLTCLELAKNFGYGYRAWQSFTVYDDSDDYKALRSALPGLRELGPISLRWDYDTGKSEEVLIVGQQWLWARDPGDAPLPRLTMLLWRSWFAAEEWTALGWPLVCGIDSDTVRQAAQVLAKFGFSDCPLTLVASIDYDDETDNWDESAGYKDLVYEAVDLVYAEGPKNVMVDHKMNGAEKIADLLVRVCRTDEHWAFAAKCALDSLPMMVHVVRMAGSLTLKTRTFTDGVRP